MLGDKSEELDKQWNVNLTVEDVAASLREDFQLTVADSDALLAEESVHHAALQVLSTLLAHLMSGLSILSSP